MNSLKSHFLTMSMDPAEGFIDSLLDVSNFTVYECMYLCMYVCMYMYVCLFVWQF